MSLRDEINTERTPDIRSDVYKAEDVFDLLISEMYEKSIRGVVKSYMINNPNCKYFTTKIDFRYSDRKYINSKEESAKYISDSDLYNFSSDYETGSEYICLKGFYDFKRKDSRGCNKIISLTPSGQKALCSLRKLAEKDGITIEDPIAEYYCEVQSFWGNIKRVTICPKLGEWFSGEDPAWKRSSGGHVYLNIAYSM